MNPSQPSSSTGPVFSMGDHLSVGDSERRHSVLAPNGMPLSDDMQMNPFAVPAHHHRMSMDAMIQNGAPNAAAYMIPIDLNTDNPISLDPQMSGEHYAAFGAGGTLPMGGMPGDYASSGASILTEFTKRRNWSQRILEELKDFLHILTPAGRIVFATQSCEALTGHAPGDLINKLITDYIHPDDSALFVREFNESIATGRPLRLFYRFRKSDDTYCIFEAHGHPHIADAPQIDMTANQSVCKGFFMMARPYPTRNAALLDSFLEHKIENERLLRRIEELRREELAEQALLRQRQQSMGTNSPFTPGHPGIALTRQNLGHLEAVGRVGSEGLRDKMARFDAASRVEDLEMLTGLRFAEGERSKGISTGDTSPALIRGDAGVPIPIDKETRQSSDKKKKQKMSEEYVCTDCGTLDSPEWRKGPKGPKTLCNACGLRWAKREKKRMQSIPKPSSLPPNIPPNNGVAGG